MSLALLGPLGTPELLVILLVALLLFGGRLPDVARSLGKSFTQFKRGLRDVEDEIESSLRDEPGRQVGPPKDTAAWTPPAAEPSAASETPPAESAGEGSQSDPAQEPNSSSNREETS